MRFHDRPDSFSRPPWYTPGRRSVAISDRLLTAPWVIEHHNHPISQEDHLASRRSPSEHDAVKLCVRNEDDLRIDLPSLAIQDVQVAIREVEGRRLCP